MRLVLHISSIFLMIFPLLGSAQYLWDIGMGIGGANYLGEIGGKDKAAQDFVNDLVINQTRPAITGFVRYKASPTLYFKGSLTGLRIQGSDNLSTNPGRVARNLHFRNDIAEIATTAEINYYQLNDVGRSRRYRIDFRSYFFFGLAGYYHNPKASLDGEWIALNPLRTEGQVKPYSRFQIGIPMGMGFYYTIKKRHRFGWEFGWRKTFTDYLDDISTSYASAEELNHDPVAIALANRRNELNDASLPHYSNYEPGNKRGDPSDNDNYFVSTVSYSYVIRGRSNFYRSKYSFIFGNKRKKRKTRAKF